MKEFEEKKYYCEETEESFTESELFKIYQIALEDGDTFGTESFDIFKMLCMEENNGSLREVKELYSISVKGKVVFSVSNIKSDIDWLY